MSHCAIDASFFFQNVDYGEKITYVIGHRPADADSVFSAIALAHLYNIIGIKAQARIASEIDRETEMLLDFLGIQAPEILQDAFGEQLVLVDHNSLTQAVNGAENARIVGICDHHGLSGIYTRDIVPVFILPLGSTGTVIYTLYKQFGVEITRDVAAVMAAAIMSDTNNCRYSGTSGLDSAALTELLDIAGIDRNEFNRVRLKGRVDYAGMTDRQVLLSDYRKYDVAKHSIGISYARSVGNENHMEMIVRLKAEAERYYPESGTDLLYVMIHDYETNRQDILCFGKGAKEVAIKAVGSADGEHISPTPCISRKKTFLPALAAVLKE